MTANYLSCQIYGHQEHVTKHKTTQNCEWKQGTFLRRKSLLTVLEGFASFLSVKRVILLKKNKKAKLDLCC